MVPFNLTCLHCLQQFLLEHLFNLYYYYNYNYSKMYRGFLFGLLFFIESKVEPFK